MLVRVKMGNNCEIFTTFIDKGKCPDITDFQVTICNNETIAAGAALTKDVPEINVVGGISAKFIKKF